MTVTLPIWLALLLGLLLFWALFDRLLLPGARWFLRRRVNRVLEEINTRLKIRIPPFKLTKREVLIDRLLYDPQVQEAAEAEARDSGMPREAVQERLRRYAQEIVPAFNAYIYFRLGYWLARNLAGRFPNQPPNQKDYILVSYLAAEKSALSYAVGEWARIWPLQTLIRAM